MFELVYGAIVPPTTLSCDDPIDNPPNWLLVDKVFAKFWNWFADPESPEFALGSTLPTRITEPNLID